MIDQKLLPFKKLDCENVNEISNEIYSFLVEKTNIINMDYEPWRFLTTKDFVANAPLLIKYFSSLNLKLRDIAAVVIEDETKLSPHKDAPPVIAKINFPVINTLDTYNVWWDDDGNEIDRVEMIQPIAFNASITHGVEFGKNPKFPRIVVSCMFIKQPLHLLVP